MQASGISKEEVIGCLFEESTPTIPAYQNALIHIHPLTTDPVTKEISEGYLG
jgi:hypothetical protein